MTLFAGKKKYVIFLTCPVLRREGERKQMGPKTANKVHTLASGSCCPPRAQRFQTPKAAPIARLRGVTRLPCALGPGSLARYGGGWEDGHLNPPNSETESLSPASMKPAGTCLTTNAISHVS